MLWDDAAMSKFSRVLATAAAVVSIGFAAAGCEGEFSIGGQTVDAADLETKLADQLAPQAGVKPSDVSVSCPDDQDVETGAEFNCTLTAPNGDEVEVNVTLTDEDGGFSANVPRQQFK